jgi:hypothetical protein
MAWQSYEVSLHLSRLDYYRNCYKNSTLPAKCNAFIRPNIPLKLKDTPRPFINKTMCATEGAGTVGVDSGLLDVSSTFWMNLPSKDRVQNQRQTVCTVSLAPLFAQYAMNAVLT